MHSFNDIFVVIVATMEKTKKKKTKSEFVAFSMLALATLL